MLYDASGRPFTADPPSPHKVEDPLDGYTPERRTNPEYLDELRATLVAAAPAQEDAPPALAENFERDLNSNLAALFGKR